MNLTDLIQLKYQASMTNEEKDLAEANQRIYEHMMRLCVKPPVPGERIIVSGLEQFEVTVSQLEWVPSENRYRLLLDWGEHGTSVIYSSDEGTVWRRFLDVN